MKWALVLSFSSLALVLAIYGAVQIEKSVTERLTGECWQRWEGRDVRFSRRIGCQVRDSVGWVPEGNMIVTGSRS